MADPRSALSAQFGFRDEVTWGTYLPPTSGCRS